MKVNGMTVIGNKFAYDGCHKIYVIEDKQDFNKAIEYGYRIYPNILLKETYDNSCELRFISNWKLTDYYVKQFEEAVFEEE